MLTICFEMPEVMTFVRTTIFVECSRRSDTEIPTLAVPHHDCETSELHAVKRHLVSENEVPRRGHLRRIKQ